MSDIKIIGELDVGEPEIEGLGVVSSDVMEVKTVSLKICEREFVVDAENFADER